MSHLTHDALYNISIFLPPNELYSTIFLVCKEWNELIADNKYMHKYFYEAFYQKLLAQQIKIKEKSEFDYVEYETLLEVDATIERVETEYQRLCNKQNVNWTSAYRMLVFTTRLHHIQEQLQTLANELQYSDPRRNFETRNWQPVEQPTTREVEPQKEMTEEELEMEHLISYLAPKKKQTTKQKKKEEPKTPKLKTQERRELTEDDTFNLSFAKVRKTLKQMVKIVDDLPVHDDTLRLAVARAISKGLQIRYGYSETTVIHDVIKTVKRFRKALSGKRNHTLVTDTIIKLLKASQMSKNHSSLTICDYSSISPLHLLIMVKDKELLDAVVPHFEVEVSNAYFNQPFNGRIRPRPHGCKPLRYWNEGKGHNHSSYKMRPQCNIVPPREASTDERGRLLNHRRGRGRGRGVMRGRGRRVRGRGRGEDAEIGVGRGGRITDVDDVDDDLPPVKKAPRFKRKKIYRVPMNALSTMLLYGYDDIQHIAKLLDYDQLLREPCVVSGNTLLHYAVHSYVRTNINHGKGPGLLLTVEDMLTKGVDVHAKNPSILTPLALLVYTHCDCLCYVPWQHVFKMVKLLLAHGASLNDEIPNVSQSECQTLNVFELCLFRWDFEESWMEFLIKQGGTARTDRLEYMVRQPLPRRKMLAKKMAMLKGVAIPKEKPNVKEDDSDYDSDDSVEYEINDGVQWDEILTSKYV